MGKLFSSLVLPPALARFSYSLIDLFFINNRRPKKIFYSFEFISAIGI